ncbi:MAG: sigma-70 family RNA polymerase sigma factor [candidate division Zixibacteria bacterium]|nr:sigma-70 family RNA polymerase sigma factor [candidate division Zixibacteria bacterium]
MTDNLHRLWQKVQKGDPQAWREVVRMYSGLVNTVARRTGLAVLDAEDCAQHIWMTLYKKRKTIRDPVALPAWLIKTTHREAARIARRLRPDADIETAEELSDSGDLPDEVIIQLEHRTVFDIALRQLDPRCRRLLEALFYSPHKPSYKAIAKSLNILPNSIGPLRNRCLQKLKEILQKMGYDLD